MEKVSFSYFGKDFQEKLVGVMIKDRQFCDQIGEVLDYNYFDSTPLKVIVKKVYEYKDSYKQHPSVDVLKTIIKTELDGIGEVAVAETKEAFVKIIHGDDNLNEDFVKDRSLDFCKKQVLKTAMIKSIDLLTKCSFDEISVVINKALKLGLDLNYGYDYLLDFDERFKTRTRNPVTLGWPELDNITQGGLGRGELGVIIALSGAGKSHLLVHMGAQALMAGKTVVHYTLELSEQNIACRYDSCITKAPLNDLKPYKDKIYDEISKLPGRLIVKEYPTKSASVRTIENHLEKLRKKDIVPDAIIVDYGDLLKPVVSSGEKRDDLQSIYEELRAIAQRTETCLWTASQTNRKAWGADVIEMDSISEAFNKVFVADVIISLSRTKEDKTANMGRLHVAKNRMGVDGVTFDIFMDTSNVQIKILSPDELEKLGYERPTMEEREKEAYREYKNNKAKINNNTSKQK